MRKLLVWAAVLTVVAVIEGPAFRAPRTRMNDPIWVINSEGARVSSSEMRPGDTFSAGRVNERETREAGPSNPQAASKL
jgi:hypothetical protein